MHFLKSVFAFLFRPDFLQFSRPNAIYFSSVLCLGLLIGSGVSVIVIGSIVYGFWHLAWRRLSWQMPVQVKAVSLAMAGLFGADLIAAIINPSRIAAFEVVENLPLLGLPALFAVIVIDREKLLKTVETTAAIVSMAFFALVQVKLFPNVRPEFFAGNINVAALLACLLYALTSVAAIRNAANRLWLAAAGALASGYLVIISETRALWPCLLIVPVIAILVLSKNNFKTKAGSIALLVAALGLASAIAMPRIVERWQQSSLDIEQIEVGNMSGSLGQRLAIYEAGTQLFVAKPIFGYGPGNERAELTRKIANTYNVEISYSHAHNAFLNQALRSGVIGVLALLLVLFTPLIVAFKAEKDSVGLVGFTLMVCFLTVYFFSGITGLMLGHDIHDTVFVSALCFSLYLTLSRHDLR